MNQKLPHTIQNCVGEELTFQSIVSAGDEKRILVHASCKPGAGPAMHVHFRQDESLTVRKGKMGYQILGEAPKVCEVGETILFPRGTPHKFWAADGIDLEMEGWIEDRMGDAGGDVQGGDVRVVTVEEVKALRRT